MAEPGIEPGWRHKSDFVSLDVGEVCCGYRSQRLERSPDIYMAGITAKPETSALTPRISLTSVIYAGPLRRRLFEYQWFRIATAPQRKIPRSRVWELEVAVGNTGTCR